MASRKEKQDKTVEFHSRVDATKDAAGMKHVDAKMHIETEPNLHKDVQNLSLDQCECAPGSTTGKTPKDVNLRVEAHTNEAGRKEIDMKFHFEGKRDHLDDDKEKDNEKDEKDGHKRDKMIELVQTAAMAMSENAGEGPSGMVGAAVTAVGQQIAGHGRSPEEMAEFRENGGVIGVVKQKIGEKMYEKGEDLKTKHPGEVVRTVPDAIKYHYAHAEFYHREGRIQEELSKKEVLTRADRKTAKKKAQNYFDMEKAELSRAHAEERLLAAPIKVEYLEDGHHEHRPAEKLHDEQRAQHQAAAHAAH